MVEKAYVGAIISSPNIAISDAVSDSLGRLRLPSRVSEGNHEACTCLTEAIVMAQKTSVSTGKQTAEPIGENAVIRTGLSSPNRRY
jgi:hypothetical protein